MSDENNPYDRERLEKLYRDMSDEELGELAASGGDLTEEAREALDAEIARRKLTVDVSRRVYEETYPEKVDLVMVGKYLDLSGALPAKAALETADIPCFLRDDNLIRMDWFISNLLGGVKLLVRREDADVAAEALNAPIPDSFEAGELGTFEMPRCPKCKSLDVAFENLNKPIAYTSAWVGVPIPFPRNEWKCHACGCRWREEPDPEPPAGTEHEEQ